MESDDLLLNISTENKSTFRQKQRIYGNRGQRIKQRKELKKGQKSEGRPSFHKFSEFDSGLSDSFKHIETETKVKRTPTERVNVKQLDIKPAETFSFNFQVDQPIQQNFSSKSSGNFAPRVRTKQKDLGKAKTPHKSTKITNVHTKFAANEFDNANTNYHKKASDVRQKDTNDAKISETIRTEPPTQPTRIISSLFKNNPEVPVLSSTNVETIKEEVFSDMTFRDLPLQPHLVNLLEERYKYTRMTRVQQEAIPKILEGRDVLLKSQTGSGKTMSYAVPITQMLQAREPRVQRSDGIYALVIVPTRELAIQSFNVFQQLVNACCWVVPGCLMGGEKRKAEKARIRTGINILVATLGRLLDHTEHTTNMLLSTVQSYSIRIRKGINILVATPGRLLDHTEHTTNMLLSTVQFLVIDEADRLLDLGFERDISKIIENLRECSERQQTILLSATLSERVERLAGMTLHDPCRIYVSKPVDVCLTEEDSQKSFALPQKLRQLYVIVPAKLRLVTLAAFILAKLRFSSTPNKLVIFLSTVDSVSFHYALFSKVLARRQSSSTDGTGQSATSDSSAGQSKTTDGGPSQSNDSGVDSDGTERPVTPDIAFFKLHGDMPQKERSRVYADFHSAKSGVLLCTDVAARGLDLPHVTWIIQYTTPGAAKDYIHRVGRTARIGTAGHALLFLLPAETKYVDTLATHHISVQSVDMKAILKTLQVYTAAIPQELFTRREKPRTVEESATYLQMGFENYIHRNSEAFDMATKAFLSFIRAYATYPAELKDVFHVRNLHLGHLAKSFALSEAPTKIGIHASELESRKRKHDNKTLKAPQLKPTKPPAILSEFDSGLNFGSRSDVTKTFKKRRK